jgi:hypothetical protein
LKKAGGIVSCAEGAGCTIYCEPTRSGSVASAKTTETAPSARAEVDDIGFADLAHESDVFGSATNASWADIAEASDAVMQAADPRLRKPGVQVPAAMRSTSERPHTSMEINAAIAPRTTLPTSSSLIMGMPPPIKVPKSRMMVSDGK